MSPGSKQGLNETEAHPWSDSEVMNADGSDGLGKEYFFI